MFRAKWTLSCVAMLSLLFLGAIGTVLSAGAQVVDPAVMSLKVAVTKKLSATTADIEIVGIVKNIGTKTFKSGRGQASVRLYENVPGAKGKVVLEREITTLKADAQNTYRYTTKWDVSREFPPDYTFQIDYDPDIRIDGNPDNDDENLKNNKKSLKGSAIHKKVSDEIGK